MGLDQYLIAKLYLWNDDEKEIIKNQFPEFSRDSNISPQSVSFEIHYWRKANAIHRWFVNNVQGGIDDCREYVVSIENLNKLLETINKVLGRDNKEIIINRLDNNICEELLPSYEGFFFGTYEYDEWYFSSLKETKEMIEKILNSDWIGKVDLFYSSSW